jgi:hypothetical protein
MGNCDGWQRGGGPGLNMSYPLSDVVTSTHVRFGGGRQRRKLFAIFFSNFLAKRRFISSGRTGHPPHAEAMCATVR